MLDLTFVSSESSRCESPIMSKCPLCRKFKNSFYCTCCVWTGEFTGKHFESYNRYKEKLDKSEEDREELVKQHSKLLEDKFQFGLLQARVESIKERLRLIRLAKKEKEDKHRLMDDEFKELRQGNQVRNERLKAYKTKSEGLEDRVSSKRDVMIAERAKLQEVAKNIQRLSRLRVEQLFKYIFPISEVNPAVDLDSSSDSTMKELAEACLIAYIKDKWVCTDSSNEQQYSVVAPCLPRSGNYSTYSLWAHSRENIPISEENTVPGTNPALSISYALMYTAQLVNVLSFFLNVRLPYKMIYSEFNSISMNEQQFNKRVARLNANILHLCISQKVPLNDLEPTRTVHNVLLLLDKKVELGRQGPLEIDQNQVRLLEQSISNQLKSLDDSDSDEGDSVTSEWEAVPHVQCPEAPAGPANVPPTLMNQQQASSLAGGLMNSAVASVASFWKGFTGR